jgi:rhodanese-related sulfurtransferase
LPKIIIFEKIKKMNLTQENWSQNLQKDANPIIIDVRTEEEFNEGYIPNALNMDIYKGQGFIYQIDELDKSKNCYVYCRSGGRSAQACNILKQMGFQNAYNLDGGFMDWQGEVAFPE